MSEILLPEPYYNGNIRTTNVRPRTVPATIGATKNETNVPFRPASGCQRLNEYTQDGTAVKGGIYRMPTSHKLQKLKGRRPQSPLEVISEQPGVRVMKSKGSFVAEVSFGPDDPRRSTLTTSDSIKKPALTTSAILRQEMEEDTALEDIINESDNEFRKIAKLQSKIRIRELEEMLKVREAELLIKEKVLRQMQQQLDEFQFQLGEERLNHSDTRKAYEQRLATLRVTKDNERETATKNLTAKYETKIEEINMAHEDQVNELKSGHARIEKKLEDQIEHLENAFDEFRVSFTSEMELKWKRREEEMRKKIIDEADSKWQTIVTKNLEAHNDEVAKLKKKQVEEIEVMKHEHESEVNSLLRKYKDAYSLSEKVARQQQLIEGLHERLREFETKLEDTTRQLADKTREAAELTMRLTTMERDFSQKLQQNAEMWQARLESYITENADIKRLYAFSVHKMSCDRIERDLEMRDRARNAAQLANARLTYREQLVEAVLHSRIRTGLPLVPSNPPTEDEERRIRQAQLLRQRAAKLGASIVEATDIMTPGQSIVGKSLSRGGKREATDAAAKRNQDVFAATGGRPMSAPTTDVENFCVFMAAAAAVSNATGSDNPTGEKDVDETESSPSNRTSSGNRRFLPSIK